MKASRFFAAAVVAFCAVILLQRAVLVPWRINVAKKTIEQTTVALIRSGNAQGAISAILRNLDQLNEFTHLLPHDVELHMLTAANLRLLGRTNDAVKAYSDALEYDRRPEIYFNRGLVQLEAGRRKEAIEDLVIAVRFRADYLKLIGDPFIREAVNAKSGSTM